MNVSAPLVRLTAALCLLLSAAAHATDYPLSVTDLAGRQVTIEHEPRRIVLQDGRDLFSLALLDREDPFERIAVWNNIIKRSDPNTWQVFQKQWPKSSGQALDMQFGDDGDMNLEAVVAGKPDLLVFQLRARKSLEGAGVERKLSALKIPVIYIDSDLDPVTNSQKSVALLGKVLDREARATEYLDFYKARLALVDRLVTEQGKRPLVFVEAKAGQGGATSCCFTHGDVYWGKLVQAAGGDNLGSRLLPGATGDVTLETVISKKPEVYVMSGTQFPGNTSISPPFGFGPTVSQAAIDKSMAQLLKRPGMAQLQATQQNRVYGVYHQFYASSWNILSVEYLAQAFYPQAAERLDPAASTRTLLGMTGLGEVPAILFGQAPASE
ncbi:iron complex transport system substrate-binding protein [Pseudomonas flavescens]|uniref:Iron complex transport system substrate-binding protein n=1 Tax=Phytopseudomonas flavescens TaxID=29435 RepID=A0A1G8Q6D8_9GAMM|nr:ABC transporter substrate-binding protein [Pseudomonas flavescens]SDJ00283.1 iron complex transport system substrate-binding protein [Pseudomonas flavescens]